MGQSLGKTEGNSKLCIFVVKVEKIQLTEFKGDCP